MITAWSFLSRHRRADPNRDPNAEKSRWIQADTVDRPPSRKHTKAPESVAAQRFPALIVSSHAGGHRFESGSLRKKLLISYEIRSFLRLRIPPSAAPAGLGGTRTFRRHHHLFCILIPQQRKQIIFALSLQSLQSAELIRWASFLEPQLFCRWL